LGAVSGVGPIFLLRDTGQESLLTARYALAKFKVEIAEKKFSIGGSEFPAGSWILPAQDGLADTVRKTARDAGLWFLGTGAEPGVPSMSTGAADWSVGAVGGYGFDRMDSPHSGREESAVRLFAGRRYSRGGLRDKVDVILLRACRP